VFQWHRQMQDFIVWCCYGKYVCLPRIFLNAETFIQQFTVLRHFRFDSLSYFMILIKRAWRFQSTMSSIFAVYNMFLIWFMWIAFKINTEVDRNWIFVMTRWYNQSINFHLLEMNEWMSASFRLSFEICS